MSIKGIDVYKGQGDIDFCKVKTNENIEYFLNEMHKMLKELEDKYRKD